jgi:glycosyltransferase involved in cell wall biosynthesis
VASVGQLIEGKNPLAVVRCLPAGRRRRGESPCPDWTGAFARQADSGEQGARVAARVQLTGLIARENVYEHLSSADVFVFASRGEGLPVAVLEAMACRCPVVLSDIPPHREVAAGADFIPLVAPDDASGFAREIRRLRGLSARQRAAIGEECRRIAERRFSLGAMHRAYEEVYAEVLREAPPARKVAAHRA